ncbi:hypothetical protein C8J56DRAFT_1037324 [Mycena floridula]|nr:hypothetical protein C8J56DRAFT_1037324 [Mycena floridula]
MSSPRLHREVPLPRTSHTLRITRNSSTSAISAQLQPPLQSRVLERRHQQGSRSSLVPSTTNLAHWRCPSVSNVSGSANIPKSPFLILYFQILPNLCRNTFRIILRHLSSGNINVAPFEEGQIFNFMEWLDSTAGFELTRRR